jgi:hypothetical protein
MKRAPRHNETEEAAGGLALPDPKTTLKAYYAGNRMESPVGGVLEVLRVQPVEDGSAKLLLECNSSSLRYELPIKKATRTEKTKVKQRLLDGIDPTCPRHGEGWRLTRVGPTLVCPACGVPFGKAL